MLRSECRPVRAEAFLAAAPKLLAVSLGLIIAACSADVTRFDAPMFGLTGGGNRPTSALVPRESVYGGSRLAQSTPYDSTYRAPSYDRYAAAAQSPSRPVTGYAPASGDRYGSSYQRQPSRPDYRTPPYRTTYESPPRQPFGSQSADRTAPSSYQPQPETRLAALPPPSAREPDRPLPSRQPVETTPPQSNQRSAPVRAAPSAGSLEIEVQPGDTLYGLAERHDISISELMTLNGLTNPVLRPGQKLMLPKGAKVIAGAGGQKSAASTSSPGLAALSDPAPEEESSTDNVVTAADEQPTYDSAETYTIKPGESLYRIAVMRGISLAELQRINNIDDPRKVRAGTVLKLPPARSTVVAVEDSSPVAPRPIAPQPSHERNQPEGATAPAAETSGEPAATPVIINAPKQKERIASLEPTRSMSDAAPLPLTTVTPNTEERAPAQDNRTAEQQADGVGKFRWPVRGRVIAGFGKQRDGTQSDGIKLAVPVGTEVHAAESGVVVFAGSELKDYGNLVLLRHENGWITAYAHNDELMVKRGDRVRRGQVIAKAGKTGNAETPQLHFELRKGSDAIDPIPYLE